VNGLQGVPVIGRADDDGIKIFEFEQFLVLFELPGLAADFFGGEIEVGLIKVADGDDLRIGVSKESVENLITAIAQADEAKADAVVSAKNTEAAEGGGGAGGGDGFGEVAAGHKY